MQGFSLSGLAVRHSLKVAPFFCRTDSRTIPGRCAKYVRKIRDLSLSGAMSGSVRRCKILAVRPAACSLNAPDRTNRTKAVREISK